MAQEKEFVSKSNAFSVSHFRLVSWNVADQNRGKILLVSAHQLVIVLMHTP